MFYWITFIKRDFAYLNKSLRSHVAWFQNWYTDDFHLINLLKSTAHFVQLPRIFVSVVNSNLTVLASCWLFISQWLFYSCFINNTIHLWHKFWCHKFGVTFAPNKDRNHPLAVPSANLFHFVLHCNNYYLLLTKIIQTRVISYYFQSNSRWSYKVAKTSGTNQYWPTLLRTKEALQNRKMSLHTAVTESQISANNTAKNGHTMPDLQVK